MECLAFVEISLIRMLSGGSMLSCDPNWLQSDFYWQNRLCFPSEINSEPITAIMEKWTLDTNIVLCVLFSIFVLLQIDLRPHARENHFLKFLTNRVMKARRQLPLIIRI